MSGDRILPWIEAKRLKATNPAARWRDVADEFGGEVWPRITARFKIRPGQTVFTIGSCFARNIERHLALLGCRVPMLDFALPPDEWEGQPSSALNRFHPPSFRQSLAWALRILDRDSRVVWSDCEAFAFEVEDGGVIDLDMHITSSVTRQRFVERRQQIFEVMAAAFSADCVMMTPGLIEAWRDLKTGLFIHGTPAFKRMMLDASRWELAILSYETCLQDMLASIDVIRARNPDVPVLLTTSPVPMALTFSGDDIRVANAHSKAVLRAACGSAATLRPMTDYFPSYESVTQSPPDSVWKADRMHVSQGFIGKIVGHMLDHYLEGVDEADRRHQEAVALVSSGDLAQAEAAARAALAVRADHVGARAVLGEILLRYGQWRQAEAELAVALMQDPERLDLKVGLARAVGADPARLDLALAMLEEVVASPAATLENLLVVFDFIRKRAQDEAAAERILRQAIDLFPLNVQARQPLIDLLLHQGRKPEAMDQLRLAIGESRSHPGPCLQLAGLLAEAGERDEAWSYIERALLKEPRNKQALAMRAALVPTDQAPEMDAPVSPRAPVLASGTSG
jgi:tetratricopeptide (TPR) repeat protein